MFRECSSQSNPLLGWDCAGMLDVSVSEVRSNWWRDGTSQIQGKIGVDDYSLVSRRIFSNRKGKCPNWSVQEKERGTSYTKFIHPLTLSRTRSQLHHTRAVHRHEAPTLSESTRNSNWPLKSYPRNAVQSRDSFVLTEQPQRREVTSQLPPFHWPPCKLARARSCGDNRLPVHLSRHQARTGTSSTWCWYKCNQSWR